MRELPPALRSAQMWLNVDDVLAIVPIGRSTLYDLLTKDAFPKPYHWNHRPLWSQKMIHDWIREKSENGSAKQAEIPVSNQTPITWTKVAKLLKKNAPRGMTNRQIANYLNGAYADVCCLTRIMAKAGVLLVVKPLPSFGYFYTFNEGHLSKEA